MNYTFNVESITVIASSKEEAKEKAEMAQLKLNLVKIDESDIIGECCHCGSLITNNDVYVKYSDGRIRLESTIK